MRARAWVPGKMAGPAVTQTYLIDIPVNLPIISISTDSDNLWHPDFGIYTVGTNGKLDCRTTANWNQSWQRAANIEFYELDGTRRINQQVGLEIFGNCTRNYPRKSLEIKAQKLYGDNDMDYAFFPGDKPMDSYKRLVLRNAGQDNYYALLRDSLAQTLTIGRMDVDRQAYRPAVVYLNGEYWGLYDMREKMDEDYVENNYDLDEEDFDVLEQNSWIVSGDNSDWLRLLDYIKRNNPASPAVYANIEAQVDIDEFMNYLMVEIFVANTDWPNRNSRFWDDHGSDYRWRWMLRDMDAAFLNRNINLDMIKWAKKGGPTASLFKKLLQNAGFEAEFGQRFAVHLNTTFESARVISIIDDMASGIRPEMPAHIARWGRPGSMAFWESEVEVLRAFATQRPAVMRGHLRKLFDNVPDATLTIQIEGDGRVLAAGAEVPAGYSGRHFKGVPITLTALPDPGWNFTHWLETGETSPTILLPFSGDTTRMAVFGEEAPLPAQIGGTPGALRVD